VGTLFSSPWSPVVCLSTFISIIRWVRHMNLRLTEQFQREKTAACDPYGRDIRCNKSAWKKGNVLLIICLAVGCANGTVRIIEIMLKIVKGLLSLEIKWFLVSGCSSMECMEKTLSVWVEDKKRFYILYFSI
jgi:hypothetical protein